MTWFSIPSWKPRYSRNDPLADPAVIRLGVQGRRADQDEGDPDGRQDDRPEQRPARPARRRAVRFVDSVAAAVR